MWLRKTIVWAGIILMVLPFVTLYVYDMTLQNPLVNPQQVWLNWFVHLAQQKWPLVLGAAVSGWTLRFMFKRYPLPAWSGLLRQHRNPQTVETLSDIRDESLRFKEKSFVPSKYYRKEAIVIGLDEKNQPIAIPIDTWHETNMQVIGPTRYGKGIILGTLDGSGDPPRGWPVLR